MKSNKVKLIAHLGVGTALYIALGMVMNIPLLAGTHLQTDLGYIVLGVYCYILGWPAFIIGVLGCMIESLLTSGWVPIGWMVGQALIGLLCGFVYRKTERKWIHILTTVVAVFIGVAVIKTGIECALYTIPILVKFPKNAVAFVADAIPMIIGLILGYKLKKMKLFSLEG